MSGKISNVFTSSVLDGVPGLIHGFGTKEQPQPIFFSENVNLPKWKQVHGVNCVEVSLGKQLCGEADALYSKLEKIPVAVMTADCVPILIAHRSGKWIAAVHAGWRGTRARILHCLWNQLKGLAPDPQEWVAAIGPSIGPCCYQVSIDLAQDFTTEFKDLGLLTAVPRDRFLDLPGIQAAELKKIGFDEVDLMRFCTYCSVWPAFYSFRRDGTKMRQWSGLMKL